MAGWPPKRGAAFDIEIVIRDADGDPIAGPAGLSAVISKDGAAQAALTATPAVVSAGSKLVEVSLNATEATADRISGVVSSTSTGAKDAFFVIYTETSQIRDIQTDTDDIQTRIPAALVGGRMDSSTGAMAANVLTAAAINAAALNGKGDWNIGKTGYSISGTKTTLDALNDITADSVITAASGTADSGTTTTLVDAARTEADTDYWKGSILLITSGTIAGQTRRITAFNAATDTITVDTAFTQAVGINTYIILRTAYGEAPAAGSGDWTAAEKENIRYRIGVDGTQTAPTNVPILPVRLDAQGKLDVNAEADTALVDYDAPTNAEMTARTVASATYATSANQTTILNRLGDFAGTGLNTVKGFFQAMFRKDAGVSGANLPAEINEIENTVAGTYDATTDSQEATRDTAPLGTAMRGTDSAATAAALATAQADLDIITGADGATLATAQALYAPSKAGDAMALINDAITAAKVATDALGALELAADAVNEIADGILDRNMGTGTDSGSPTVRTMRQALRFLRNRWAIAAGTLTVYKEDDLTASWTSTITTTAGNPVSESDPPNV